MGEKESEPFQFKFNGFLKVAIPRHFRRRPGFCGSQIGNVGVREWHPLEAEGPDQAQWPRGAGSGVALA